MSPQGQPQDPNGHHFPARDQDFTAQAPGTFKVLTTTVMVQQPMITSHCILSDPVDPSCLPPSPTVVVTATCVFGSSRDTAQNRELWCPSTSLVLGQMLTTPVSGQLGPGQGSYLRTLTPHCYVTGQAVTCSQLPSHSCHQVQCWSC